MGVWSEDIINGDSTLELAMEMLVVAGLAPPGFPRPKIGENMEIHMINHHEAPQVSNRAHVVG
jgi:hypothetical protein